jgi:hypothetical protein
MAVLKKNNYKSKSRSNSKSSSKSITNSKSSIKSKKSSRSNRKMRGGNKDGYKFEPVSVKARASQFGTVRTMKRPSIKPGPDSGPSQSKNGPFGPRVTRRTSTSELTAMKKTPLPGFHLLNTRQQTEVLPHKPLPPVLSANTLKRFAEEGAARRKATNESNRASERAFQAVVNSYQGPNAPAKLSAPKNARGVPLPRYPGNIKPKLSAPAAITEKGEYLALGANPRRGLPTVSDSGYLTGDELFMRRDQGYLVPGNTKGFPNPIYMTAEAKNPDYVNLQSPENIGYMTAGPMDRYGFRGLNTEPVYEVARGSEESEKFNTPTPVNPEKFNTPEFVKRTKNNIRIADIIEGRANRKEERQLRKEKGATRKAKRNASIKAGNESSYSKLSPELQALYG